MWVNINYIKVSEKQARKIDRHKVEQHRAAFEQGLDVMAIDVIKLSDEHYCIDGNGRHRYFGALAARIEYIEINLL